MKISKKENKLRLDYNNMMQSSVGEQGFTEKDFKGASVTIANAFKSVQEGRGHKMMGWTELPTNQKDVVEDILKTAKFVRKNFDYFVVLGIGGSALGPISAFQALCHLQYNDLKKKVRKGPKFYVEDNIDPERMEALLDVIDINRTMFNVITKSGSTSETMTQYLIIKNLLTKKLGKRAKDHIIATTSEFDGNLIKIAKAENYKTFYIPDGVGGRFSELCPVGLFPAAVLNIDIKAILEGAKSMDVICSNSTLTKNPALMAATLQYLSIQKGKNISVMMPYADGLKYMADWYAQLWGESLGKNRDLQGNKVSVGQTPVKSLGVTDQHSQVQLYAEGPNDKVITFIAVDNFRSETDIVIPDGCRDFPNVNFLCGHTMSELLQAERKATEYAVTKAGKLNHTIYLPELNAYTYGELLYFFMMKTAYCGAMLNIDTFNQPGVEEGKNATYGLLGRPGYEAKKEELNTAFAKATDKYLI
ncbi:MAG: glucose-6-phosphate isomerase [Clostridia bacterium]